MPGQNFYRLPENGQSSAALFGVDGAVIAGVSPGRHEEICFTAPTSPHAETQLSDAGTKTHNAITPSFCAPVLDEPCKNGFNGNIPRVDTSKGNGIINGAHLVESGPPRGGAESHVGEEGDLLKEPQFR